MILRGVAHKKGSINLRELESIDMYSHSDTIDSRYRVITPLCGNENTECYLVEGEQGEALFLKLLPWHRKAEQNQTNDRELELVRSLQHPSLLVYRDSGVITEGTLVRFYYTANYLEGCTLHSYLLQHSCCGVESVRLLGEGLLNVLIYLHMLPDPVTHIGISSGHVVLPADGNFTQMRLVGFGYASQRSHLYPRSLYASGVVAEGQASLGRQVRRIVAEDQRAEDKHRYQESCRQVALLMFESLVGMPYQDYLSADANFFTASCSPQWRDFLIQSIRAEGANQFQTPEAMLLAMGTVE